LQYESNYNKITFKMKVILFKILKLNYLINIKFYESWYWNWLSG